MHLRLGSRVPYSCNASSVTRSISMLFMRQKDLWFWVFGPRDMAKLKLRCVQPKQVKNPMVALLEKHGINKPRRAAASLRSIMDLLVSTWRVPCQKWMLDYFWYWTPPKVSIKHGAEYVHTYANEHACNQHVGHTDARTHTHVPAVASHSCLSSQKRKRNVPFSQIRGLHGCLRKCIKHP